MFLFLKYTLVINKGGKQLLFFYFLTGYTALYLVVWLHEVGHALLYTKYKCKKYPFQVHVPIYLFFSTPQPVDDEMVEKLTNRQFFNVGLAGIAMNLFVGLPISLVLYNFDSQPTLLLFFIYSFALFHLVEAMTYLTISTLFLSGDIVTVQYYQPLLRIPLFLLGISLAVYIFFFILNSPSEWHLTYSLVILLMMICMGFGRVLFTYKHKTI